VVTAVDQRIDTFTTGAADAFYTNIQGSADNAVAKVKGSVYNKVDTPDSIILMGNNRKPPFDDLRVRQIVAYGVDRKAAVDIAAKGSTAADNFTVANTIWSTPDGALPKYDLTQAQKLVDAYVADKGKLEIKMTVSTANSDLAKFVQTSLNQLKNVSVSLEIIDAVTFIGKVRGLDFQFVSWGLPWTDPDVSLATFFKTGVSGNYSGYSNATVDAAVNTTSATIDNTKRVEAYKSFFKQLAADLPVLPLWHGSYGYVTTSQIHGISVYEDGIPRLDLAWKAR
jgi:ABC-type transport system substrate-binding protein